MGLKGNKIKKYVRAAAVCLTAFATAFTLAGCANSVKDRSATLSDNILNVCNEQIVE